MVIAVLPVTIKMTLILNKFAVVCQPPMNVLISANVLSHTLAHYIILKTKQKELQFGLQNCFECNYTRDLLFEKALFRWYRSTVCCIIRKIGCMSTTISSRYYWMSLANSGSEPRWHRSTLLRFFEIASLVILDDLNKWDMRIHIKRQCSCRLSLEQPLLTRSNILTYCKR